MQQQPPRSQSSTRTAPAPDWIRVASSGHQSSRPPAKTSTERGKFFRQRQKAYEAKLATDVEKLRVEIAQLSFSKWIWSEKALVARTNCWGSLVARTREMYTLLKHGLESVDPRVAMFNRARDQERIIASMQFKENFLRKVYDRDVVFGGVVSVDFVLDQWRKHTKAFSYFEIELGQVERVSCSEDNPIVVIHLKLHAQISHQTFPVMFPFVLPHGREDLMHKVVDRDLTFDCVARLEFSEAGKIVTCDAEMNYVSVFMQVLRNARDVADLMLLSVILPDASLADPESVSFIEDGVEESFDSMPSVDHDYEQSTRFSAHSSLHDTGRLDFDTGGSESDHIAHLRTPPPKLPSELLDDEEEERWGETRIAYL